MRLLIWIVVVVAILLGALYLSGTHYAVRQKLGVSVNTPEGIRLASSVQKLSYSRSLPDWVVPGGASGSAIWFSGEAVVLEVAPGKFLFALLNGTPRAWDLFFPRQPPETLGDKMADLIGQTRTLTPDHYPLLVTFGDIKDPASVRRVDPNDLAASFGPGYRLNAITMTITDEPVTEGKVEKVLGWLNRLDDYRSVKDNPFTSTLPEEIGYLRNK